MRNKSAVGQSAVGREDHSISSTSDENRSKAGIWKNQFFLKLILALNGLFTVPALLLAQGDTTQAQTVDMATTMRSSGKIYVVVAVLTIILLGLFFYLIRLDRKIGKLEKES